MAATAKATGTVATHQTAILQKSFPFRPNSAPLFG